MWTMGKTLENQEHIFRKCRFMASWIFIYGWIFQVLTKFIHF